MIELRFKRQARTPSGRVPSALAVDAKRGSWSQGIPLRARKIARLRHYRVDAVQSGNNFFLQMSNPAAGGHSAKTLDLLGGREPDWG
jgi:hypothetical protein